MKEKSSAGSEYVRSDLYWGELQAQSPFESWAPTLDVVSTRRWRSMWRSSMDELEPIQHTWPSLTSSTSSSLISEVNFTYTHLAKGDDGYRYWGNIDTLMTNKFSALSVVTIEWRVDTMFEDKVTWDHCISQSIAALPKSHQKGILRPVMPPQIYLK